MITVAEIEKLVQGTPEELATTTEDEKVERISEYLSAGGGAMGETSTGSSLLVEAARQGYAKVVERLLMVYSVRVIVKLDQTALSVARASDHENVEKLLVSEKARAFCDDIVNDRQMDVYRFIDSGGDVNAKDSEGNTLLMIATVNNKVGAWYDLLREYEMRLMSDLPNNDPNQAEAYRLYMSIKGEYVVRGPYDVVIHGTLPPTNPGYISNIEELKEKFDNFPFRATVLEETAKRGHTRERVDVNAQNENGDTALILGMRYSSDLFYNRVAFGRIEGLDVNIKNNKGKTALNLAVERKHDTNIFYLLKEGAIIDASSVAYCNSLRPAMLQRFHECIEEGNSYDTTKWLPVIFGPYIDGTKGAYKPDLKSAKACLEYDPEFSDKLFGHLLQREPEYGVALLKSIIDDANKEKAGISIDLGGPVITMGGGTDPVMSQAANEILAHYYYTKKDLISSQYMPQDAAVALEYALALNSQNPPTMQKPTEVKWLKNMIVGRYLGLPMSANSGSELALKGLNAIVERSHSNPAQALKMIDAYKNKLEKDLAVKPSPIVEPVPPVKQRRGTVLFNPQSPIYQRESSMGDEKKDADIKEEAGPDSRRASIVRGEKK